MKKIIGLDEYQKIIIDSLLYPPENKKMQLEHGILALCGESGELANVLKKIIYHKSTLVNDGDLIDELSDVLWYVSYIANALNVKLSELATYSINKMFTKRRTKEKNGMMRKIEEG